MDNYVELAVQTEVKPHDEMRGRIQNHTRLIHAALGLSSEAGEFCDQLKRHLFYGKELDLVNLKEEMGDLLWYMALTLDEIDGTSIQDLMETNVKKLRARYPAMFTEYDAQNRDLEKEREILEAMNESYAIQPPTPSDMPGFKTAKQVEEEMWTGSPEPTKLACPENIVIREDQELPVYKPACPPLEKKKTNRDNLIEKYGKNTVDKEYEEFYQDFYTSMRRNPSDEDVELFYYRWWKRVTKSEERPTTHIKPYGEK